MRACTRIVDVWTLDQRVYPGSVNTHQNPGTASFCPHASSASGLASSLQHRPWEAVARQ